MSRRQFVLTPEARGDVIEIWNYIAEDSIDHADQVLAQLTTLLHAWGKRRGLATTGETWPTFGTAFGLSIRT